MPSWRTQEGENGAINTDSELTTDADATAPGVLQSNTSPIVEIASVVCANIDTSADQGTIATTVGGDGVDLQARNGRFPSFAAGIATATIASVTVPPVYSVRVVNIKSISGSGIRIGLATGGDDVLIASAYIGITE